MTVQFSVLTDYPVAFDSLDHTQPFGSVQDWNGSPEFCDAIKARYGNVPVLDLGCAGAKMVREFLDRGHLAIGLEGCDSNRNDLRHEWANIPDRLFTCDISRPFSIQRVTDSWGYPLKKASPAQFGLVTAWEVLEHIPMERLPTLLENIRNHLLPDGRVMGSIPHDVGVPTKEIYHVTWRSYEWWRQLFLDHGFSIDEEGLELLRTKGRVRGEADSVHAYKLKGG